MLEVKEPELLKLDENETITARLVSVDRIKIQGKETVQFTLEERAEAIGQDGEVFYGEPTGNDFVLNGTVNLTKLMGRVQVGEFIHLQSLGAKKVANVEKPMAQYKLYRGLAPMPEGMTAEKAPF